jgi:hypothetical protein
MSANLGETFNGCAAVVAHDVTFSETTLALFSEK